MALEFRNYTSIREGNKEFTRSDLWEISFISKPACYFPGDDFINTRCVAVNPGLPGSMKSLEHNIRGFIIHQATTQDTASTASLQFVDREDLAIRTWVESWKNLMADRDTLIGARKSDYTCDILITYFNTSLVPISRITLYACMLSDATPNEDGTNDPSSTSDVNVAIKYEHYKREMLTGGE